MMKFEIAATTPCRASNPGQLRSKTAVFIPSKPSSGASGDYRIPGTLARTRCFSINYNCVNSAVRWAMNRSACAVLVGVCLLSLCGLAQENRIIRVGVATMENRTGRGVPGNAERDRLVGALNGEKPDKKLHLKVQGVPLDGATPEDVGVEAK